MSRAVRIQETCASRSGTTADIIAAKSTKGREPFAITSLSTALCSTGQKSQRATRAWEFERSLEAGTRAALARFRKRGLIARFYSALALAFSNNVCALCGVYTLSSKCRYFLPELEATIALQVAAAGR